MSAIIAIIRDAIGDGVRCDRVDGWEAKAAVDRTRVYLSGGGIVDLRIPVREFVQRLDRALTEMAEDAS